jgi:hypothetical protein
MTKLVLDVARNRDENGQRIANPQAPFLDQVGDMLRHAGKAIEPGAVTQARRIVKAARGQMEDTGRVYDLENEAAAVLTGARSQSVDVGQGLLFKAKRFAGERQMAELIYREVRDRKGTVGEDELSAAREKMEQARRALYDTFAADIQAARRLGISQGEAVLALKGASISDADITMLLAGHYRPYIDNPFSRSRALQGMVENR